MAMLDEMMDFLEDAGLGVKGEDIFAVSMPDRPGNLICLNQYQGRAPDGDMGSEQPAVKYPRLQVLARASQAQDARDKIHAVYAALCNVVNETVGSTRYLSIWPIQEPAYMEDDENNRSVWVCNFELQRA